MTIPLLLVAAGLVLLYLGGEGLVQGASRLSLRLGLSPLAVGLTVVAFGTSSPELVVSLRAAVAGVDDVALGNVVGSNICNIALILGMSALVRPLAVRLQVLRVDVPLMIGCSGLLALLLRDGVVSRREGLVLAAGIVAYTAFNLLAARREKTAVQQEFAAELREPRRGTARELGLVVAGLAALALGGDVLVRGAVELAAGLGLSEAVIGLTLVALGTSLPELATSVVAAARGHGDLAVGNVVGSNLFNILAVLGTTATVHPVARGGVGWLDVAVMIAVAVVSLPLFHTGRRVSRLEGVLLMGIYAVYVGTRL